MLFGLYGGQMVKESSCNAGDPGSIPGSGRSPEGNGNSLQYFCLKSHMDGECHGQGILAGYSLWGHKESDTTKGLILSLFWMLLRRLKGVC